MKDNDGAKRKETHVKAEILTALGGRPDYLVWNHPTGVARALTPPFAHVRYGLPGSPDVIGVHTITITADMVGRQIGVAIGIETKHPKGGTQREQQKKFQAAWEARGGIYILTRESDNIADIIGERAHESR